MTDNDSCKKWAKVEFRTQQLKGKTLWAFPSLGALGPCLFLFTGCPTELSQPVLFIPFSTNILTFM